MTRKILVWNSAAISLLGTMPDSSIARQLGIARSSVRKHRVRRGIPAFPWPQPWSDDLVRALGQQPDSEVAAWCGKTELTIAKARRKLGIKAVSTFRWSPDHTAMLGTASDAEVAAQVGRSAIAVRAKRKSLGIPLPPKPRFWTAQRVAMLGTATDVVVAQRLGVTVRKVRSARATRGIAAARRCLLNDSQIDQLGSAPDAELARAWGVSMVYVRRQRMSRGIAIHYTARPWTEEELALTLTLSDREVAKRTGRTKAAVFAARYSRGIAKQSHAPHPHLEDIRHAYTTTTTPVAEIAAKFGVNCEFISRRARRRGWVRPGPELEQPERGA